jgi:hypothetical protein
MTNYNLILVRRMSPILSSMIAGLLGVSVLAAVPERDYAKLIVGSWTYSSKDRPTRIIVFHADGSWGVRKFDDRPEDIRGRRWRLEGDTLVLTYPHDHGFDTSRYQIVSFALGKFVTENSGYRFTYTRIEQPR